MVKNFPPNGGDVHRGHHGHGVGLRVHGDGDGGDHLQSIAHKSSQQNQEQ